MASHHTRSLSFPSKPHPIADQLDEQLCRLKSSQAASTSSLTNKLTSLKELYQSVDEFLQLPIGQKTISQTQWTEEMLDGSLRLLDICATSRDALVQSKERLQDIQSVLRRRCSGEFNITSEVDEYLKTRKTSKKIIKKCLKDIKEVDNTNEANVLKDVQALTVDVFKSLLSYISGSQKSSWSFSKLISQKAEKDSTASTNEFDVVDATLELMICQKKKANIVDISQLVKLESEIQEIEEVLESLFRHLIKTRATLLNVLSN
ncbi:uncharacterized protein LOC104891929 [Beta vulgaris subsp. vulgaris]|uniref:uncharacterized protein LOC104891929 n=1 Tax=Beta vulgaris subsp. vulgaris TaxID=3555 RepID=UPI002036B583|nr:uncharacterized protein LOC104891929 [Beta vulgaris subsp. vulgaris]